MNEYLNLEHHILPVLEQQNVNCFYDDVMDAIQCEDAIIQVVHHHELRVIGDIEIANIILEHAQPFGKELTIHHYPTDY